MKERTAGVPIFQKILHIFLLSGFLIAQPLLDLFGKNTQFLVASRAGPEDIYLLLAVLCLHVPGLIAVVELVARAFGQKASDTVHLGLVLVLSAALCLIGLNLLGGFSGTVSIAAAVLAGSAATWCYWKFPLARTYLNFLSPAILVIPVYFLLNPQVEKLVSPVGEAEDATAGNIASSTPIVILVFDEFPVISLLDEKSEIDQARYPNFARLAANATWYRNAQTVSGETEAAVPTIVTGLLPQPGLLPIPKDHPDTLFTLFRNSHKLEVFETITSLCPGLACGGDIVGATDDEAPHPGRGNFFSDVFIVYLHLLVPKDLAGNLPAISQTWTDFNQRAPGPLSDGTRRSYTEVSRPEAFANFLGKMSDSEKPGFYFYHTLLPHVPWRFFPSGKAYKRYNIIDIPGLDLLKEQWGGNDWLVTLGQQRHLLQVGFTDRLIGDLIERLQSQGIYDKSLVIVTADHGVSFWPGSSRRARGFVKPGTELDVLGIPLIVKMPHQQRGQIDDDPIRTVDLVPTIGRILGVEIPWKTDGHAVMPPTAGNRGGPAADRPYAGNISLQRKIEIFGSGLSRPDGLYQIGAYRELIGHPVAEQHPGDAAGLSVTIDQSEDLASVDPNDSYMPAYLTGKIGGAGSHTEALPLAIAVNGVIHAVTTSYSSDGESRFAVIIPEHSLVAGGNLVGIYAITEGENGPLLSELMQ